METDIKEQLEQRIAREKVVIHNEEVSGDRILGVIAHNKSSAEYYLREVAFWEREKKIHHSRLEVLKNELNQLVDLVKTEESKEKEATEEEL